jgi:hypothetical protein
MRVGVIAEDKSDVDSVDRLIYSITNIKVDCKSYAGKGCTKIPKKSRAWAEDAYLKGCPILILIRDSDTHLSNDINEIRSGLNSCLSSSRYTSDKYLISIPIQELEAWLLSDPKAIKTALKLPKVPKITGNIEDIPSPKEHLEEVVKRASDRKKQYINTAHNAQIANHLDLKKVLAKCPSFKPFYDFVKLNIK